MIHPRVYDFIDMLLMGLASMSPVPMPLHIPEEPELEPGIEERLYTEPLLDRVRTSD